ncbi:MAG: sensor histidine kinase [Gaiellaceae bacterium]
MIRRLLLGYLGVTLFALVALEVPLGIQNQRNERHDLEVRVEHDATTIASLAEDALQTGSQLQLRSIAGRVYAYSVTRGARVVIVDRHGNAIIDTSARVAGRESFATRPEIRSALRGAVASGTRHSRTLHTTLLYVAVPIASGGAVHGAVRLTYPTSALDTRVLHYWLVLAAIATVVLAAAALVGFLTARFVIRPLRELEQAAAAVGEGDLAARAPEQDGPPEVRSLAAVFNETVTKLGQLLRSQEEFVADASHELRAPLTALRLRLENGDVEAALREVERLTELVNALLALARADAGKEPTETVDVSAVVRERVEYWTALGDERGVAVVADAVEPASARAAPARLRQILDNLIANAFEVAPAGTAVTVSARASAAGVELRVRDQGPGLTAAQRARAFDRFWRAGSGTDGSGLGLAIVRKLVEADEGSVELASAPGGGIDAVVGLRRA